MRFMSSVTSPLRRANALMGILLALLGTQAPAQTNPTQKLRIVGGLGALNQYTRNEEPFWTRELSRLSAGRFSAGIVPFDRAGVPGGDMLRLIQLGVVPFGTLLASHLSAQHPEYGGADLAGLNPDMASLKTTLTAYRPYMEKSLRDRHGIEALAFYIYPAQAIFCKGAISGLADLNGRRVRVASTPQSDFVRALGGTPVLTEFSQIMTHMASGNTDCAITGTMSGNTLGLHEVTTHIHALPVNWGMAIFGANVAAWSALPPDLRVLLQRELPKLESAIWAESERETAEGLACNKGLAGCSTGHKGRMTEVPLSAQDEQKRQEIFTHTVLARWALRCAPQCANIWNQTIGAARSMILPIPP